MAIDIKKLIKKNRFDNALPIGVADKYYIIPVAKPRMTRRDKWMKRDCVVRYREFCDELRSMNFRFEPSDHITFILPMPESWPKSKRLKYDGQPHKSKPDLDNLVKSICDALYDNDSGIWDFRATKIWGERGEIIVRPI